MFISRSELSPRESVLLQRLNDEYTPEVGRDVLCPLITRTSPVSLRTLDWAVVNWAKQHHVVCTSIVPGRFTNVHHAYRTTLNHWKRKLFDPFRRRRRISVIIDGKEYETTLGQANFALWTYKTGVLAYVISNMTMIEGDMNRVSKLAKMKGLEHGKKAKRSELTKGRRVTCVAYVAPSVVEFGQRS